MEQMMGFSKGYCSMMVYLMVHWKAHSKRLVSRKEYSTNSTAELESRKVHSMGWPTRWVFLKEKSMEWQIELQSQKESTQGRGQSI